MPWPKEADPQGIWKSLNDTHDLFGVILQRKASPNLTPQVILVPYNMTPAIPVHGMPISTDMDTSHHVHVHHHHHHHHTKNGHEQPQASSQLQPQSQSQLVTSRIEEVSVTNDDHFSGDAV